MKIYHPVYHLYFPLLLVTGAFFQFGPIDPSLTNKPPLPNFPNAGFEYLTEAPGHYASPDCLDQRSSFSADSHLPHQPHCQPDCGSRCEQYCSEPDIHDKCCQQEYPIRRAMAKLHHRLEAKQRKLYVDRIKQAMVQARSQIKKQRGLDDEDDDHLWDKRRKNKTRMSSPNDLNDWPSKNLFSTKNCGNCGPNCAFLCQTRRFDLFIDCCFTGSPPEKRDPFTK